jgi:hypothetical protein
MGNVGMLVLVIIGLVILGIVVFGVIGEKIGSYQAEQATAQAQIAQAQVDKEKELTERARLNQEAERHNAELRAANTNQAMTLLTPILGLGMLGLLFLVVDGQMARRTMLAQEHAAKMRVLELTEQQRLLAMTMGQSMEKQYYLPQASMKGVVR